MKTVAIGPSVRPRAQIIKSLRKELFHLINLIIIANKAHIKLDLFPFSHTLFEFQEMMYAPQTPCLAPFILSLPDMAARHSSCGFVQREYKFN